MRWLSISLVVAMSCIILLLPACTTTKRPRSDRDPYVTNSSSDPKIRAGNPY